MNEREGKETPVPVTAKQVSCTEVDWTWVDRSVWTDRMLAALGNGVKGNKWFSLIDKVYRRQTLRSAWEQVRLNAGAAGIDGQSVERFEADAQRYLEELSIALKAGHYRPQAVRRVGIPKGRGQTRPLGIPTVKDRVVQTALKRVIEPIFEKEFLPMSYGFRPQRGCKDALREVDGLLKAGYTHVVDADLKSYFDSLSHERLLARVGERISDSGVLTLISAWLKQEVVKDMACWTPLSGTPQGSPISPLLANVYLHPLDVHMSERGYRMVRYADDFVILCRTGAQARAALEEVRSWVNAEELTLHPDKTHVGDCTIPGQGFEFLGYRFEAGRREVRKKSLTSLKDKIRGKTRRTRGVSIQQIIAELNPVLRGWFGYFKHAQRWTFRRLDGFIRRRLRALLRKQDKRPGLGQCLADHRQWPNRFFADLGLFTLSQAHASASQSR